MSQSGTDIERRCNYLVDVQLWPRVATLNAAQWLTNFRPEEQLLARRLLEGFTYFSADLVRQMFRGAFANIAPLVIRNRSAYIAASLEWARFIGSALVVRVTGEIPSEADSGYIFTRIARDFIGIGEHQIVSPEDALRSLISNPRQPIVFVDDFVGSGWQFAETWKRAYQLGASSYSFKSINADGHGTVFYVALICTDHGRDHISKVAPGVRIIPAHQVGEQYSVISSTSAIWRNDMQDDGPAFVRQKSLEIGLPDRGGREGCWRGFNSLGLAIAFEHGWPDATIPLFYTTQNGWKPLIRRGP